MMLNKYFIIKSAIFFLFGFCLIPPASLLALSDQHECSFCHNLHAAPGFSLLNQSNAANHVLTVENVCLACHGPLGIATEVDVHNPDRSDYRRISCRECHDAHDNKINSNNNENQKMVGFTRDPADLPSSFATSKIRLIDGDNRNHSAPGTIRDVIYENAGPSVWDFARGANDNNICEVCHSDEDFSDHRGQDRRGTDCRRCHNHGDGFN